MFIAGFMKPTPESLRLADNTATVFSKLTFQANVVSFFKKGYFTFLLFKATNSFGNNNNNNNNNSL